MRRDMREPTKDEMLASPISVLLHSRGLDLFNADRLHHVVKAYCPFQYPDGTYEIGVADGTEADKLYLELGVFAVHREWHFRNLLPFPLRRYYLLARKDYDNRLGDSGLGLGVGVLEFRPGEWQLENLQFTVRFHRKPSARTARIFLKHLQGWLGQISEMGLSGEGPLTPVRRMLALRGTRASIWLNASRTGPRTLLWLLLEALGFGHDVALIERILFNEDDPVGIEKSLQGARNAYAFMKLPWGEADERRLLEEGLGGVGETEIEMPFE